MTKILEQHYHHISNSGITITVECNDHNYMLQFVLSAFGIRSRSEIELASPEMVDTIINMLQRVRHEMDVVPPCSQMTTKPRPLVIRGHKVTERWEGNPATDSEELVAYELVDEDGYVVETIRPVEPIRRGSASETTE